MTRQMKHKVLIFISALVVVAMTGTAFVLTRSQTTALELKPKIGNCYLFSAKELDAPSPLTNPLPCAEMHNAETYWVAKWPLELAPTRYSEDLIHDVAGRVCRNKWDFPDDADLNYWAYFYPSPAQWAEGARWLRCDAMVQLYTEGSIDKQYLKWDRSLYLDNGFLEVPFF
jgi:hypothetical protein